MDKRNISDSRDWFAVLQTSARGQTAVTTLQPGAWSGEKGNEHLQNDQVLLVVEGEVVAEIGDERAILRRGDVVIVEAGALHRFGNESAKNAVTFNVYSPPAY
ncbi:MAG: cupin domain-containing protein [Candidatus Eremiobacteraeota bacterium]|nr:cupin domain-containing protein [Candidatus Eremiobacteraeota bacterium]